MDSRRAPASAHRGLNAHLHALEVFRLLQGLIGAEDLEPVVPVGEAYDALGVELIQQALADWPLCDLVQPFSVREQTREVVNFELFSSERPELSQ